MQIERPSTWNKHSLRACTDYLFSGRRKYKTIEDVIEGWIFWAESQGWQFEPPTYELFPHQQAMLDYLRTMKPMPIKIPEGMQLDFKLLCMGVFV